MLLNRSKNEPCSIVSDCGLSKAEVLKIKLERKYEDPNISAYDTYLDSDFELLRIMSPDIPTIVVCAIDKPIGVVEYVEDLCKRLNISVVSGGLGIKYGHVKISNRVNGNNGEFFAVDHASYYEKWENKYNLNIISASNGSTNGVIACLMSHIVVSYVIGIKQFCNIEDQILQFDFEAMNFSRLTL